MFMPASPFDTMSMLGGGVEKARPRMLSPGYYSQECNAHKPCDKGNIYEHLPRVPDTPGTIIMQ